MPKINPTINPKTIALASLSTVPAKNPTAKIIAKMNENHEKPINKPIKDNIMDIINAMIVGFIIVPKLILSNNRILKKMACYDT